MAHKRQSTDSEFSIPEKKSKENQAEFNGTVFRSMLKEPTKVLQALETFTKIAKKLPCANLYDVVEGYLKISAECTEILTLLEGDAHSETELKLIFQSLELILLRTASDLSHFNLMGSSIVKMIVSSHMKSLQSFLSSGNRQLVRQCLCLMTAMVSQGTEAAGEVFSSLVLNRTFSNLARMRDKSGRPDVRMSYIQFAVSFLMYGDTATIGHVLDTKDFLSEILNTGLKEDRISTISLILSTFQSKVVKNTAISKTQKLRFFTASTLTLIASLYRWNGTVDIATDQSVNKQEGGRSLVRESVHNFLLDLCCSRTHGISFHDPSLGTARRAGNIVLLQFAVSLKQAIKDEKVSELVVSILKCNPDILQRYFIETQLSFTPRMNEAWLDSIALLKKIYEFQPEVSQAFQLQEMVPTARFLSMVLVTSIPPVCNKAFFTQGLNLHSIVGQHATLSVIAFILRRAQKNIEHSLKRPVVDSFHAPNAKEFVQLYREALSKVLPDITSLVSKWQTLSKNEKKEGEGQMAITSLKSEDVKAEDEDEKLILFKALLLQVIRLYQKVVPHLVTESKFDFSKLIKGIVSEKVMKEQVPSILQYELLQLALELPASRFSCFRFQDVVAPEWDGQDRSVLHVLLKMFVNIRNTHLRTTTRMLILKVLRESGAFEHNWTELELWLDQLLHLEPSQQATAIQFLDLVLMRVVFNPCIYMDKVAVMVQEAVCVQDKIRGQDRSACYVPISHGDDMPGVLEVVIEDGEKDANLTLSLTDDIILQIFPFSAAVPAALEFRNKQQAVFQEEKKVLCEYICAVLCDILHTQRDPLALCLTLKAYDTEVFSPENISPPHSCISSFQMYYYRWLSHLHQGTRLSQLSLAQSSTSPPGMDFSSYLKACYCDGPATFLLDSFWKDLEQSLSTLKLSETIGAVSQTLLYLKSFVENFGLLPKVEAGEVVNCILKVLHKLFLKLSSTAETPSPQIEPQKEACRLNMTCTAVQEVDQEQVLSVVFHLVFKHPVLLQWFLALELGVMPSHSLNPEQVRQLGDLLTQGVLNLLRLYVDTRTSLPASDVIIPYLSAIQKAMLMELQQSDRCPVEKSQSVEAFLKLYEYMDPSNVHEVLSALLLLPQSSLLSGGDEISLYGKAVLTVLTKSMSDARFENITLCLSPVHLYNLVTLHNSCRSDQLEDIFLQVLHREPSCAKLIPTDILLHCLHHRSSLELAALLVQNCSTHCLVFELWCLEQTEFVHVTAQNRGFLSLLSAYLQHLNFEDPCRPKDVQNAAVQVLTKALLAELTSSVLRSDLDVPLDLCVDLLSGLIPLGATASDLTKLIRDLPVLLEKPESSGQRWQLADIIMEKLSYTPAQLQWRKSLLTAALRWLSAAYKEHKIPLVKTEEAMLQRLKTLLICPDDFPDLDWNVFVKSGLKYRYTDRMFVCVLGALLDPVYSSMSAAKRLLPLETLHMMVTSHSLFLPTMLAPQDGTDSSPSTKEALVTLLFSLVKKCPTVCRSNHFHVLLGAYGATLSSKDQKTLLLLKEYENNNTSLMDFQYLLWGHAAVEYHKARKSLDPSLWQHLSSDSLLDQLVGDRMLNTVAHFPLHRHLIPQDSEELMSIEENEGSTDKACLYDPSFLMPLFSYMVRPESVLNCRKFVCGHALGVTVAAMSSYDPKMRAAAYHVLASFYQHLECAHFKEKKQLLYLLDTFRNAIQKKNLRVSFIHTTYIAKVALQILRPEDHMYLVISKFLLGTQYVDLKRVPDYFRLFYSFDLEHKLEREWLLNVLKEGMRDGLCYELCEQQSIFHSLLGFCSSPLCDRSFQIQIVKVLWATAHLPKASHDFSKAHGILAWILQLTERRNLDRKMLTVVVGLLHTLWFLNIGQTGSGEKWSSVGTDLPFSIINDFLCALLSIITHLRTGVEPSDMERFLQTLGSVLKHHDTALNNNKEINWLPPQTLSCSDVLALFHCWGTLTSDTTLLCDLHNLFKVHNIKVLKGAWQEEVKEAINSKEIPEEKYVQCVMNCKPLLLSILTHWEPWPTLHNNYNNSNHLLNPAAVPPSASLVTAQVLSKWTLGNLADVIDDHHTFAILKWFEKVVVPHEAITKSLMSDEAVRVNLLRLYHQTCEKTTIKLDTLQLFTTIMLHMIKAEKTLHQKLTKACLHSTSNDPGRAEAGLKLLSLYIPEIWSGTEVPRLLLKHAQLITRKNSKKSPRTPIMQICEDILSAVNESKLF